MEKLFYQVKEMAKLLNVSYPFLDRKIRENKIEVVWFGKQRLIRVEEFNRIVKEGIK